jgi:hypothetical protein
MTHTVTLELPDKVLRQAQEVAARTQRSVEDVLAEWMDRYVDDLPVKLLSDEALVELCEAEMPDEQQAELSDLLAGNRENILSENQRMKLDELMQIYRHGLVRKAEALKVAVERGLRPPLG